MSCVVLCRGDFIFCVEGEFWRERLFAFVWCGFVLGHLFAVLTLGVPYFFAFFHFFQIVFQFFTFLVVRRLWEFCCESFCGIGSSGFPDCVGGVVVQI